jgi:hypothetical protein
MKSEACLLQAGMKSEEWDALYKKLSFFDCLYEPKAKG